MSKQSNKEIDGKNIYFSISAQNKGNTSAEIIGEYTNFVITKSKNEKSNSNISGSVIDFNIKTIGRWTFTDKKASVCMICKLPLKSEQDIKQCPMCNSLFHHEHIVEWLKVKGKCPVCQQNLGQEGLEIIKL
ncbi:MAG: hypothetical protein EAX90_00175 [Candidatus Heimdallarchaeota archaeon]|nr:hypothetical protein [Candidatus Heimdallarchaeota archaeon]